MVFDITELLLNILHSALIACVLAHVVTEFDSRAASRAGNLDDDVERLGLFAVGFVREVICGSLA